MITRLKSDCEAKAENYRHGTQDTISLVGGRPRQELKVALLSGKPSHVGISQRFSFHQRANYSTMFGTVTAKPSQRLKGNHCIVPNEVHWNINALSY